MNETPRSWDADIAASYDRTAERYAEMLFVERDSAPRALNEMHRVLRPGGALGREKGDVGETVHQAQKPG